MSEQNLFELASREKLRFWSSKGELTTEQLWDLSLTSSRGVSLNELAVAASRGLRELGEESFVDSTPNPLKKTLQLRLEILKRVIEVKQAENAAAAQALAYKAEADRIRGILAEKGDEALKGMSESDLKERLKTLEGK